MPFMPEHEAAKIASLHHDQGVGVSLATGCFDIIHRGHVELLERAAMYGPLFVGINTDEYIKMLKGEGRPIHKTSDRAAVLCALNSVRIVFPIADITVSHAIRSIRPKWWVKGGEYTLATLNQDEVMAAREVGAEILFAPEVKGFSTTGILAKL
jgi:D-beta-D-heptose 7-phosphate kinase/D-beta-D-heptose 1-phosphate adenosyltransferase